MPNIVTRIQRRQELMYAALLACHNFFEGANEEQHRFYSGPYPGVYARIIAVLHGQDQITNLRAETPDTIPAAS